MTQAEAAAILARVLERELAMAPSGDAYLERDERDALAFAIGVLEGEPE